MIKKDEKNDLKSKYSIPDDCWIVDQISPIELRDIHLQMGIKNPCWVKLISTKGGSKQPVRYLLTDRELCNCEEEDTSNNYERKFSEGYAFRIDWKKHVFKFSGNPSRRNRSIAFVNNETVNQIHRDEDVEDEIERRYQGVLQSIKNKKPPQTELFSKTDFLTNPTLNLHILNVGQGDTIVIGFPDDTIWLIDAYFVKDSKKYVMNYTEFKDWLSQTYPNHKIDKFIISHLHKDHIKSAIDIINDLNPHAVLFSHNKIGKTTIALETLEVAHNKGILYNIGELKYGSDDKHVFECRIKSAYHRDYYKENPKSHNDNGLLLDLKLKNSHILLPGDASHLTILEFIKEKWYNYLKDLPCQNGDATESIINNIAKYWWLKKNDSPSKHIKTCFMNDREKLNVPALYQDLNKYFKVNHHGSETGFKECVLDVYSPTHAYTSCGKGNRYKHPRKIVRDKLKSIKACHEITSECKKKSIDVIGIT